MKTLHPLNLSSFPFLICTSFLSVLQEKIQELFFNSNVIIINALDSVLSQLKYLEALFTSAIQIHQFFFFFYQMRTFSLCSCILIYVTSYQIINIYITSNFFFFY